MTSIFTHPEVDGILLVVQDMQSAHFADVNPERAHYGDPDLMPDIDNWFPVLKEKGITTLGSHHLTSQIMDQLPSEIKTITFDSSFELKRLLEWVNSENTSNVERMIFYTGGRDTIPVINKVNTGITRLVIPLRQNISQLLSDNTHVTEIGIDGDYFFENYGDHENFPPGVRVTIWSSYGEPLHYALTKFGNKAKGIVW